MLDSRVSAPSKVLQWDALDLEQLTQADPEFGSALSKLATSSLVIKLISFIQPDKPHEW